MSKEDYKNNITILEIIAVGFIVIGAILIFIAKDLKAGASLAFVAAIAFYYNKTVSNNLRKRIENIPAKKEEPHKHEMVRTILAEEKESAVNKKASEQNIILQQNKNKQPQKDQNPSSNKDAHKAIKMHDIRVSAPEINATSSYNAKKDTKKVIV